MRIKRRRKRDFVEAVCTVDALGDDGDESLDEEAERAERAEEALVGDNSRAEAGREASEPLEEPAERGRNL